MNKVVIVDTSKVKGEIVKSFNEINENFNKMEIYLSKVKDYKCLDLVSDLDYLSKRINSSKIDCDDYTKKFNSIIKDFNNLSMIIVKKTAAIEKVNAASLMSHK